MLYFASSFPSETELSAINSFPSFPLGEYLVGCMKELVALVRDTTEVVAPVASKAAKGFQGQRYLLMIRYRVAASLDRDPDRITL